ncbi:MAG: putative selenate reductase subunit YgfK [FCB group bacterium]|nr:putative selenate reductase subunit YgfK [FCB group bacterium]
MSDRLTPLPIEKLLSRILTEFEQNSSILGIYSDLFFHPDPNDVFRMERYGEILETPIGVAAGPHTQLSQNIIAAWLCGARYIELKTIQTLDELEVAKPCIDMEDEGYNCEWSQELKLRQSHEEYLNAWILIHLLREKFSWITTKGPGVIFNMSAGYDLKGIRSANVQHFLDLMEDSSEQLSEKLDRLSSFYPAVKDIDIPARISESLTVSTMHGCPPDEIEKIGRYFLEDRGYHTTIKLNPTLLGADRVREILNVRLGYDQVIVPDEAFRHDLKYDEALILLENLRECARDKGLHFGLKLTNTLEVENHKSVFPPSESMAYLSGRPLHPISINLAARLQQSFGGKLDISFSAGVDAFNIVSVIGCDIKPVTTCSDLLKPGGYTRLLQYLEALTHVFKSHSVCSLEDYIKSLAPTEATAAQAGLAVLTGYAETVCEDPRYRTRPDAFETIKTDRNLESFDCIKAPCVEYCATDQEIPRYLYYTAIGDFQRAAGVVLRTNPFPGVTGYVCDHLCQLKCTRNNLDNTLLIREIKRFLIERSGHMVPDGSEPTGQTAAIIGAGPSGLSCAYFLALEGFEVTVFEADSRAGGMVSRGIPVFRLPDEVIAGDIETIEKLGVDIRHGEHIDRDRLKILRADYDFIYISVGAALNKNLGIPGENLPGVLDPIQFLAAVKAGKEVQIGRSVAVIGGGNTAIDAARTARRLVGPAGEVSILYRRTRREMPADQDEIQDALKEGINLIQLLAPEKIEASDGRLRVHCTVMEPGTAKDASGRRVSIRSSAPSRILQFDTLIPAIGQDVEAGLLENGVDVVSAASGTSTGGQVFYGGDALRGASSVVNAVGDGRRAAACILESAREKYNNTTSRSVNLKDVDYQKKLSHREYGAVMEDFISHEQVDFNLISRTLTEDEARREAARCLYCDEVCNICVSVCPNLANISYRVEPREYQLQTVTGEMDKIQISESVTFKLDQAHQVLNIGDFCNECGNCTTFCPTAGRPFADKPKVFLSREAFETEQDGFYFDGEVLQFLKNHRKTTLQLSAQGFRYSGPEMTALLNSETLGIIRAQLAAGIHQASGRHG